MEIAKLLIYFGGSIFSRATTRLIYIYIYIRILYDMSMVLRLRPGLTYVRTLRWLSRVQHGQRARTAR